MQLHLAESGHLARFERWTPSGVVPPPEDKAFSCVDASSPLRQTCYRIVSNRITRAVWYTLIILSTLLAFAIQPRYSYPEAVRIALFSAQCACLSFFWFRMLLEIVAAGLVVSRRGFLRSFWNVAEVTVNVFGVLQLIPPTNHLRWMRSFAALRPVRLIFAVPGLRALITPLGRSFPYLFDVGLLLVLVLLWFGMIGVSTVGDQLSGRYFLTNVTQPSGSSVVQRQGKALVQASHALASTAMPRLPAERGEYYQFNNIGSALLVLLQVSMGDSWYQPLEDLMCVLGAGAAVYLVVVAVAAFCVLAMMHAVVRAAYARYMSERRNDSNCAGGNGRVTAKDLPVQTDHGPAKAVVQGSQKNILTSWRGQPLTQGSFTAKGRSPPRTPRRHTHDRADDKLVDLFAFPSDVSKGLHTSEDTYDTEENVAEKLALITRKNYKEAGVQTADSAQEPLSPHSTLVNSSACCRHGAFFAGAQLSPPPLALPNAALHTAPAEEGPGATPTSPSPSFAPRPTVVLETDWVSPTPNRLASWQLPFWVRLRRQGIFQALSQLETTTRIDKEQYQLMSAFRVVLCKTSTSMGLSLFLELVAVANVALLAVVYTGMPVAVVSDLCRSSAAMSILFLFVLLLRLAAFGVLPVLMDAWNAVDLVGAVSGILEFAVPRVFVDFPVACGILRALRTLHLLKYVIPAIALRAKVKDMFFWLTLTVGTVCLYGLLGMQLFAQSYARLTATETMSETELAGDFSTVWGALLAVFTSFTTANVSAKVAHVFLGGTVATGALFFFSLVFLSVCLLQPLLLTLLIDGFRTSLQSEDLALERSEPPPLLLPALTLPELPALVASGGPASPALTVESGARRQWLSHAIAPVPEEDVSSELFPTKTSNETSPAASHLPNGAERDGKRRRHSSRCTSASASRGVRYRPFWSKMLAARTAFHSWREALRSQTLHTMRVSVCFLFSPSHRLRRWLLCLFGSVAYRIASVSCVVVGLVALFFERRELPAGTALALHWLNVAYVVVFWAEMVLKWATYGIAYEPGEFTERRHVGAANSSAPRTPRQAMKPFFAEPLNWVDIVANGCTFAGIFYPPLRVGRVVHALRLFTSPECPSPTFHMLLGCLASTVKVLPFVATTYVLFAVLGLHLFAGRMHICSDASVTVRSQCVGEYTYTDAITLGNITLVRAWRPTAFRYDHFGHAILSVYVTSTVSNWTRLMVEAMSVATLSDSPRASVFRGDAANVALAPLHSGYYVVYFVGIILLVRMVALRTITASLAAHFAVRRQRGDLSDDGLLPPTSPSDSVVLADCAGFTRETPVRDTAALQSALPPGNDNYSSREHDANCFRYLSVLDSIAYVSGVADLVEPLGNPVSRFTHAMLTYRVCARGKPLLDYAVGVLVLAHTGFNAARHAESPEWQTFMSDVADYAAIGVYAAEALARVTAYGYRHLARRVCFLADLVILALLVVGVAVPRLAFFRCFAVVKLIRLSGADMTIRLCLRNWRFLANALALYFLVLMTYAVVGTLLFGAADPDAAASCSQRGTPAGLSANRNFNSVLGSLLVLFDCSTGDNWHLVMLACGGGLTSAAVVYFVTFVFFANLLTAQLALAVFIEAFVGPARAFVLGQFIAARVTWSRNFGHSLGGVDADKFLRHIWEFPSALTGLRARRHPPAPSTSAAPSSEGHAPPDTAPDVDTLCFLMSTDMKFEYSTSTPCVSLRYVEFVRGVLQHVTNGALGTAGMVHELLPVSRCSHHNCAEANDGRGSPSSPSQGSLRDKHAAQAGEQLPTAGPPGGAAGVLAFSPFIALCVSRVRARFLDSASTAFLVPPSAEVDERVRFSCDAADAAPANGSVEATAEEDQALLQVRAADVLVPTGALPIPGSNFFLFNIPEDDEDDVAEEDEETASDTDGSGDSADSRSL